MKKSRKLFFIVITLLGIISQSVLSPMTMGIAATITSDNIENLLFDDHIDMTGKTVEIIEAGVSADKSAVVELQNNYLIATGIGTAKVRIDGDIHKITVEKAKINLIMIMGQSNAGNHFPNATSDVTCPIGTAYWWGNGNGTSATEPVHYTQPSMGFHTPLLAELYAQSVAAGDPIKNVMIWEEGITSKNGQSIVKWAASATDTSGTDAAVTMLENCRAYYEANSDKYEIVGNGVYWLQGESDTSMNPILYTERFMAMWQRLKSAGMEYLAFLRVRAINVNSSIKDDLYYTSSLSAQTKMINDNLDFYMATTVTENWIGAASDTHTVDISNYITMMETYGKSDSYTDQYGNNATFSNGKLTTTMKSLYGSNNTCHYGKFGYAIIGADAAYNMYRALRTKDAKIVVTDTSGYASHRNVLINGQITNMNVSDMTEDLVFRAECGSTAGMLSVVVRSDKTDITNHEGIVIQSDEHFGAINTSKLSAYKNVSITVTYTTVEGFAHTVICHIQSQSFEQQQDYIWDFNEDLYARGENGEILNSFLSQPLAGTYTLENGCLVGKGLQLELENIIKLNGNNNWSIEWKYGSLATGTAGFLLCSNKGNTVGNKAIWHINKGNFAIADYLDSVGYRNYTSTDIKIQDNDCLKLTNTYDPSTGKSTLSLWINGKIAIADLQLKGSINNYHDQLDMTQYPLSGDFSFRYMGNAGRTDWFMNCQLDYLKISEFGNHTHTYIATVTAPTCTAQGYTTHTCTICGDSYVSNYVDARGYDWMLEDGEFKILLIGNSFSEDASNAGMPNSQMLDILQAMLGENVKVTVGLCYSGGKGLNWHATQSEQGNKSYSLRVISSESGKWKSYGSFTSANALSWTNWDVVSLQHYEINTTTGKESNAYPDQVDPKFDNLKSATEFMLDYVDRYAPNAAVYFYMHWARAYKSNLNESIATYNKMAAFFPEVLNYSGTNSANRFETIIPVGLSVQNARTTYLATLAYNTTAYADKNLNLNTDAQIGLQRDGGHLSYNVGRYIAALTFAETIIPQELRTDNYVLPDIRITESIGKLPKEYTVIAQKAVAAAVTSWCQGSLDVTVIEGYEIDPIKNISNIPEISVSCLNDERLLEEKIAASIKQLLGDDFRTENIVLPQSWASGQTVTASAKIWYGYSCKDVQITVTIGAHNYTPTFTPPTCTEKGYTTYTCACGDSYVDDYVDATDHDFGDDSKCQICYVLLGDITGNGELTALDIALLNAYAGGVISLDSDMLSVADFNLDGKIDEKDAKDLKKYCLSK